MATDIQHKQASLMGANATIQDGRMVATQKQENKSGDTNPDFVDLLSIGAFLGAMYGAPNVISPESLQVVQSVVIGGVATLYPLRHSTGLWRYVLTPIMNKVFGGVALDKASLWFIPALRTLQGDYKALPANNGVSGHGEQNKSLQGRLGDGVPSTKPPLPPRPKPSPESYMDDTDYPDNPTQTNFLPNLSNEKTKPAKANRVSDDSWWEEDSGDDNEEVYSILEGAYHLCLVGATGSGKSSMLNNLVVRAKVKGEKVLILDPHAFPNKWPVNAVGGGRKYDLIAKALTRITKIMQERYEEIELGKALEGSHPRILVVIDEWLSIIQQVKTAGSHLSTLITEARKTNITVVLAAHSPYLKSLGIEDSGIRQSMLIAYLTKSANQYRVTIKDRDSGEDVIFPAPVPLKWETQDVETQTGNTGKRLEKQETPKTRMSANSGLTFPNKAELVKVYRAVIRNGGGWSEFVSEVTGEKAGRKYTEASKALMALLGEMLIAEDR